MREKLQEQKKNAADAAFENALVEAAVKEAQMDVPAPMVERKLDEKIQDMAMRMAYQGMRFEDFLKYTGQTQEQVREQFREEALNTVKAELVLKAIRKAEGVEPTDEQIADVEARYAKASGQEVEAFREGLTQAQKDYIRDDAATIAVLELLKREAKQAQ